MGFKSRRVWFGLCALVLVCTSVANGAIERAAAADPIPTATPNQQLPNPHPAGFGHAGLYGWGAATLNDGSVIIGDYWNTDVKWYAKDGTFKKTIITIPGKFTSPYGLAVNPNNNDIYVASINDKSVKWYKASTNGMGQPIWLRQTPLKAPGMQYPSRVAVSDDGRVYVADTWAQKIWVFAAGATSTTNFFGSGGAGNGQLKSPHGLNFGNAVGGKQELFVVNTGNFRVEVFNTDGTFIRKFGTKFVQSTGQGQFRGDLRGIAIDRARELVYVVDAGGNGIRVFDTAGNFIRNLGGTGAFQEPGKFLDGGRENTVDGDGNLWVGDMPNFRAQKFCTAPGKVGCKPGTILNKFDLQVPNPTVLPAEGGFNGPRGVAVDSSNNLWVVDTYNWRMQKLSPTGDPLKVFGYRGRGPYSFNYARMVAVDRRDDSMVVTDTDNHSIKKYNSAGTLLWERTGPGNVGGSGPAQFNNPHGVDIGPDGKIYVADTGNHRVQVLDPVDGHQVLAFGSPGGGVGQFNYIRGITVDACNGDIWVSDANNRDTIHHFSAAGTPKAPTEVGSTATIVNPFDVQVDRTYLYVADTQDNQIDVFNKSTGALVTSFGGPGTALGQFDTPQGLELIGTTLWVAEQQNERVQRFELNNTPGTACS